MLFRGDGKTLVPIGEDDHCSDLKKQRIVAREIGKGRKHPRDGGEESSHLELDYDGFSESDDGSSV